MHEIEKLTPGHNLQRFGVYENVFDEDEINKIRFFKKIINFESGETYSERSEGKKVPDSTDKVRDCKVASLHREQNTNIVYEKIGHLVGRANYDHFLYPIIGMEDIQYVIYDGPGTKYDPHTDVLLQGYRPKDRRISGIVMLSDPEDYEGGELTIDLDGNGHLYPIELKKGAVVFFDSHMLHQVTPLISGNRETLVFWVWGDSQI